MSDLLVRLYDLPPIAPILEKQKEDGIVIRRAITPERHIVVDWILKNFSERWAGQCDISFSNHPVSCYVAIKDKQILGFACYEATCKNFFGPTGIKEEYRGKKIGASLLLACLHSLYEQGYAYAIIGGSRAEWGKLKEFYSKTVGAVEIENSTPGIFKYGLT
jgi:N-acetylglutamate synthase-like GNAT family acetyltransferase